MCQAFSFGHTFLIVYELSFKAFWKCILFHKQLSFIKWNIPTFKNSSNYEPNYDWGVNFLLLREKKNK